MNEMELNRGRPSGLAVAVMLAVVLAACGGSGTETDTTAVDGTIAATSDSTTDGTMEPATTETTPATGGQASDADPCTILTIDEINEVFPGNDEPLAAEGNQCMWEVSWYIDLGPVSLEGLEAEEEPTGWEIRPIEIDGADWAVVRIDTNVTEYEKVLDVAAGGANGSVRLVVQNADVEWGTPTYDGLVGLLQKAFGNL